MNRIFYVITFVLLIFSFNTNFQISPAIAEDNVVQEDVLPQKDAVVDNSVDDVLDKPIFNDKKTQQTKTTKIKKKISSYIINTVCFILILLLVAFCLIFIPIANKQRQLENKRKRMSANANVINAVDNFARHRIKK